MSRSFFSPVICCLLLATTAVAADWTRFRGPNGSGVSQDSAEAPAVWNPDENVKWTCELPGPGHSCPIIVGDRIYVTSWSGYGTDRDNPGDQENLLRHLTCIDRKSGKVVWDSTVEPYLPEDEYGGMFAEHGYASHTPVSDGERIYVFFGKTGALAFDMQGKQLWQTSVGTGSGARGWGSSSSPILFEDLLILTASAESESLVALDKATGKEVWRQEASGLNSTWGTPVLVQVDEERTDLAIAVPGEIWGLNPRTGKMRWYCASPAGNSFCSSAVAKDGIVYAVESGPGGGGGIAVRAGGSGDVSDTHVVWSGRQAGRIGTPLIYDSRLYSVSRGVLGCFDLTSGEEIFQSRLQAARSESGDADGGGRGRRGGRGGQDYSSPVLADGKIYFTSRGGDVYVLEAGSEFNQLSANRVTNDAEDFSATPAIVDGEIFIRSSKALYCVSHLKDLEAPDLPAPSEDDEQANQAPGGGRGGRGGGGGPGGGRFDPAAIFARSDSNSDGKLTGEEIQGPMRENLSRIDTDSDGAVTLEEFQSGMRQAFARSGGGGGRGGFGGGGGGGRGGRGGGGGGQSDDASDRPQRPAMEN